MRLFYSALFYALTPAILVRLAWKSRQEPAYRQRWGERLAVYRRSPSTSGYLWFHAVSVGEAEAAFPLIRAMRRRFPNRPLLVTTTTPTGSARVRAVLDEGIEHVYLPYDLPDCISRFLRHFQPAMAVIMETEIWPNLFRACGERGIPLAIVNARLSERSARGYGRIAGFTRQTLARVDLIAAQSEADAKRFLKLGAREGRVTMTGNIKFDQEIPENWLALAASLRQSLFGSRPVWIAASTHEGEEREILHAYARVRAHHPELLLVLAPRHPQRFGPVASLCTGQGFKLASRSEGNTCKDADVFLLDSLGELRLFYAACDIAFVGGSLVPVGGHNVLEPAWAKLPVLFGPHMFNFEEAGKKLLEAGGGLRVENWQELAEKVSQLLKNEDLRASMGEHGFRFVESGRGALGRVEDLLVRLLAE
ncbi:MAG: lipid IV(A) 3-deoxy-D-manno-octulosonic acid transferase [Methylococcaceae bacterium]|nr:lipid IV(A) 3-deoxy-D-manno-octulosonic acid transferase [Methylococcaceae bacterium]